VNHYKDLIKLNFYFFSLVKMKRKLFSSTLGIIVGVLLFWTIIKLTNNINSSSIEQENGSVEKIDEMKQRVRAWSGDYMIKTWNINAWGRWILINTQDISKQSWMDQQEIEKMGWNRRGPDWEPDKIQWLTGKQNKTSPEINSGNNIDI